MAAPSESRIANVGGAVLTGAESASKGADGARREIDDAPAVIRNALLLAGIFEDVVLVGAAPPAGAPGRRARDPAGPPCALRGLVGALEATRAERVLVLATDRAWITDDLLLALIAWPDADVVAPRANGYAQPLCALYRRDSVLPVARQHLAAERLALDRLLDVVEVEYLDDADLARLAG